MIRILNAEPRGYSSRAREILKSIGQLEEQDLDRSQLMEKISGFDVVIVRLRTQVDRQIIDAGKRLKVVVSATTGLDHIDVEYARSRSVEVLSLARETEFLRKISATAEHTWALLLSLVRQVPASSRSVIAGFWDRDAFRGHELRGKRLGIVGLGRLGEMVAGYGSAFGMLLGAFDPNRQDWPVAVRRFSSPESLFRSSDVISIHLPLKQETRGLVSSRLLGLLPPGAFLINTSRGEILDEDALLDHLGRGRLGGAALDVLTGEREMDSNHPLIAYSAAHDNLIITPHLGGATVESMEATEVFMAQKLKEWSERRATMATAGRQPKNEKI